jgi:hypothetical protein
MQVLGHRRSLQTSGVSRLILCRRGRGAWQGYYFRDLPLQLRDRFEVSLFLSQLALEFLELIARQGGYPSRRTSKCFQP